MSRTSDRIFRAAAIERLSSPEQLDQLVRITRPLDWAALLAIGLALVVAVTWSLVGRIATRAPGEGILIIGGGKVVDAVSAAAGRLASVEVSVGDHVEDARAGHASEEHREAEIDDHVGIAPDALRPHRALRGREQKASQ